MKPLVIRMLAPLALVSSLALACHDDPPAPAPSPPASALSPSAKSPAATPRDGALGGASPDGAPEPDCPANQAVSLAVARAWIHQRPPRTVRGNVSPVVRLPTEDGKTRNVYLPACNQEYPGCGGFTECALVADVPDAPPETRIAVRCAGKSTLTFLIVERAGRLVAVARGVGDDGRRPGDMDLGPATCGHVRWDGEVRREVFSER